MRIMNVLEKYLDETKMWKTEKIDVFVDENLQDLLMDKIRNNLWHKNF